jgi:hypothetical protein
MAFCLRVFVSLFVLVSICFGQSERGADAWIRLGWIDNVLRSAHVSGSLIYQGNCGRTLPEAPPVRALSHYSGSLSKTLQEMLADAPNMHVTQEPSGLIPMAATDVPTDLLDLKIHDLSFFSSTGDNSFSHGANMAIEAIEMNPEVMAFRRMHKIGPITDGFILPGNSGSDEPIVYGRLKDVTLTQALDYILQTFPGFWVYENCVNADGERTVRLSFFERIPEHP